LKTYILFQGATYKYKEKKAAQKGGKAKQIGAKNTKKE